jgi:lysophospholipase L1-like esterase
VGYRTASIALAPLFFVQGWRLRRSVPRLGEPPGARDGVRGSGPPLRLLIVGDSAAVGVGAATQDEALSGRLAEELAPMFRVEWKLIARSGATTAGTARHLARRSPEDCPAFDVAVLSLGSNDVMGGRPLSRWLGDLEQVVTLLRERFAVRYVLVSGLPPIHSFTALPQPLRWHLGHTARRFDRALARWVARQPDCAHVPLDRAGSEKLIGADGLHPGPQAFRLWAVALAERLREGRAEAGTDEAR